MNIQSVAFFMKLLTDKEKDSQMPVKHSFLAEVTTAKYTGIQTVYNREREREKDITDSKTDRWLLLPMQTYIHIYVCAVVLCLRLSARGVCR